MKDKFEIEQVIISILSKNEILSSRKTDALKILGKRFDKHNDISSKDFDHLEKLTTESPQIVIDILNETIKLRRNHEIN